MEQTQIQSEQDKSELYKFYLTVQPVVERIFIYHLIEGSLRYIGEMWCVDPDAISAKIFNGTVPMSLAKEKMYLRFLGNEMEISYNFNNLFSKPLNETSFKKMEEKEEYIQKNVIIVNAPKNIEFVLIEVPRDLQTILQLPKLIFLF